MHYLVVVGEGERGYAYVLTRWLRQLGCAVSCAESPADVADLVACGPTAALINLDAPDGGGIAAAAVLRAARPDAAISFYTRDESAVRPGAGMPVLLRPMSLEQVAVAIGRQGALPATLPAT